MKTILDWQLSHSSSAETIGEEWIKATVPGCVQLDVAAAHNIPSYYKGDHEEEYTWMEDEYWRYRTEVSIENNEYCPYLVFKGVEYKYDVLINGEKILSHEGMFTETRVDMKAYKGETVQIEVLIYPAPKICKSVGRGLGNESAASCKPAFSYGWDWCLRLVTLGIIDEAYIEYLPVSYPEYFKVSYRMSDDIKSVKVKLEFKTLADTVNYSLFDENENEVSSGDFSGRLSTYIFEVKNPELWWPHNHGKQPLYKLKASFEKNGVTAVVTRTIGFRRVKLVPNRGTWDQDCSSGVRPADAPMTLEINGKSIFVKGSNLVPPEMCRAQLKKERVRELLITLKEANMNAVRMWGGGYIYPDFFYEMCDELGILVWQEFPLACACYSDDDEYLAVLKQESTAIIESLRTHPSIMLWCGGNELFNYWSKMTIQSKALRLLETQTFTLDEDVPFLYTSPQYGAVHGPYDMTDDNGVEGLTVVVKNSGTAFTEFACSGPSEWKYLESFMSKEALDNAFSHKMWNVRHAIKDGSNKNRCWLDIETIKEFSGCSDEPKEIVAFGNEIQCVMYKSMFEAVRRKWPFSSMCINWCYNEPWPTAAGNALINYPNIKRPCYYAVKSALKDIKLSIEFSKIFWRPGEEMSCSVWMLNDSESAVEKGKATVSVVFDGKEIVLSEWEYPETSAHTNSRGPQLKFKIPRVKVSRFTLIIRSKGAKDLSDSYELFLGGEVTS